MRASQNNPKKYSFLRVRAFEKNCLTSPGQKVVSFFFRSISYPPTPLASPWGHPSRSRDSRLPLKFFDKFGCRRRRRRRRRRRKRDNCQAKKERKRSSFFSPFSLPLAPEEGRRRRRQGKRKRPKIWKSPPSPCTPIPLRDFFYLPLPPSRKKRVAPPTHPPPPPLSLRSYGLREFIFGGESCMGAAAALASAGNGGEGGIWGG